MRIFNARRSDRLLQELLRAGYPSPPGDVNRLRGDIWIFYSSTVFECAPRTVGYYAQHVGHRRATVFVDGMLRVMARHKSPRLPWGFRAQLRRTA